MIGHATDPQRLHADFFTSSKAGIHVSTTLSAAEWIPVFAGMTRRQVSPVTPDYSRGSADAVSMVAAIVP
jgi:hypothetical protein